MQCLWKICFLNSSSWQWKTAFGSISKGDCKTAVTRRKSVLWDAVDSRSSLFVLLWHILWRKLGSQIRFSGQTTSCRHLSKHRCQRWTECYFMTVLDVGLCFTPKKWIKWASFLCASLNVCHSKLDDPVCALRGLRATAVARLVSVCRTWERPFLFGTGMSSFIIFIWRLVLIRPVKVYVIPPVCIFTTEQPRSVSSHHRCQLLLN